ncbi:hypothetical protein [Salipiger sp. PrR003]|uniref:hypothetical protein n=1 Tax=Salipiger sp. PrR003 TaxID=2706776 RepID=UPI0013DCD7F3|nr:hypothetical protein [Salipiger sp. PrR003]NDV51521.1 hypothetical protein [Salipiger sp. PrR003]
MTRMYFEPATVIPLIWALDDGFGFGAHSRPIDRLSFDRSAQHSLTIEGAGLGGLVCVTGENLEACKEAGLSGVGHLELAIHDDMNTAQLYAEDLRRDPYFTVTLHSLENGYALTAASDPLNDFSISLADQRVSASALDIQDDKLLVTALETRAALDTSTREARLAESSAYARRRHALRFVNQASEIGDDVLAELALVLEEQKTVAQMEADATPVRAAANDTGPIETYYHVTHEEDLQSILIEGFRGGHGDVGFGVYLFDDLAAAEDYIARGGWDGEGDPDDFEIIEVECPQLESVTPEPDWPDPENYENVVFHPMFENDPDGTWEPERVHIIPMLTP